MIRVKLPFGGVTPEQMEAFADVVEKYVPLNKGHITTRQNIQMHHVPLLEAEQAIRELGESGLSSREGCGNTIRNVTGDPWAGVAKDELFDLTPYAGAYVRYFVRHPTTQMMPRKIKTSFDGSPRDRAISGIHDVAFRARVKQIDGRGRSAAWRCSSAAAPRSCRVWRRRCTTSWSSTTATTCATPRPSMRSSTARTGCESTGHARGSRCSWTSTGSTSCAIRSRRS